ncbi:hypothetical protein B0T20DRAFT_399195 [Sordaria brevicollis]|uniref:Uncharacterized protein n=1 Tax=Sordaria brevicollis TaxID=83679 RepID=A0AAE0UGD1_SORBR|nr:hypothetical protein B0T20DRAFT_399195 [Sordaria brevicollis]
MLQPLHQPHYSGSNANPALLKWARDTTIEVSITDFCQMSDVAFKAQGAAGESRLAPLSNSSRA